MPIAEDNDTILVKSDIKICLLMTSNKRYIKYRYWFYKDTEHYTYLVFTPHTNQQDSTDRSKGHEIYYDLQ